ncbi:MAG TPA: undecaprenyl-diphosphate phosphatase [Solirubrobacteraceae bacterium]
MGLPPRLSLRHALALGLAHGPTELLPVSSSAHTILIPWLAGWPYAELDPELRKSFEVALHAGTAAALLIDLPATRRGGLRRRRWRRRARGAHPAGGPPPMLKLDARQVWPKLDARQVWPIALSLAPAVIAGYTLEQPLQRRLSAPSTIAAGLLVGAVAMALADARPPDGTRTLQETSKLDGLLLGLAQALALVPGVSRSGAVLTAARARGFGRADSHVLARRTGLPVILGAAALKIGRRLRHGGPGGGTEQRSVGALSLGGAAAFLSTLAAIRLPRGAEHSDRHAGALLPYALYRGLLASVVIRRCEHNRNE